jgi:thymidylate synthase
MEGDRENIDNMSQGLNKKDAEKLRDMLQAVKLPIPQEVTKALDDESTTEGTLQAMATIVENTDICNCGLPFHPNIPCSEEIAYYNHVDSEYSKLLEHILKDGVIKENRTGVNTIGVFGTMVKFDMAEGFPLLTTRKLPFKSTKVELEGFLKGITDKRWYQERGCKYWDEWCNPKKVAYGHDAETQRRMKEESDLGKIYGYQWRNFNSSGYDQLKKVVDTLKSNPTDRRMIVSAWNPCELSEMALPPCHFWWMVGVEQGRLNLVWGQRSVDSVCGLPANIASYALLLHLLAKEAGLQEGTLTGQLVDTHIYVNHLDNVKVQLQRTPKLLPKIETKNFTSIFDWCHGDTELIGYDPHPKLEFQIAV